MAIGLLIISSYLLGSIPTAHIVARFFRSMDLTRHGSGYSGVSNLWKLLSWRVGLPVLLFEIAKGIWMVIAAELMGFGVAEQVIVGVAAVVGHNWSVFSRFRGGRGNAVTLGVGLIIPAMNGFLPVPVLTCLAIVAVAFFVLHDSSIGTLIGFTTMPIVSYLMGDPLPMTLGFLAIFLLMLFARLTAPLTGYSFSVSRVRLFFNRLLFDRDIREKNVWANRMNRNVPSVD